MVYGSHVGISPPPSPALPNIRWYCHGNTSLSSHYSTEIMKYLSLVGPVWLFQNKIPFLMLQHASWGAWLFLLDNNTFLVDIDLLYQRRLSRMLLTELYRGTLFVEYDVIYRVNAFPQLICTIQFSWNFALSSNLLCVCLCMHACAHAHACVCVHVHVHVCAGILSAWNIETRGSSRGQIERYLKFGM